MRKDIGLMQWWKNSWPKIEAGILWLSVFIAPWQLRHTFVFKEYGGNYFEYASVHLYASDVLMMVLAMVWLVRGAKNTMVPKWVWYPLVLWLIWITITSWSGIDWQNSLQQAVHYWVMAGWLMYVVNSVTRLESVVWPLILGASFQAGWGIWQFILNNDLGLQILGEAPLGPNQGGVAVVGDELNRQIRAYGLLPHPNILGAVLAGVVVPAVWLYQRVRLSLRWLVLGCLAVLGVGIVVAFSRMSWLVVIASGVVVGSLVVAKKWKVMPAVIVMVVATGLTGWWQWANITGRFEWSSYLEQKSVSERIVGWQGWQEVIRTNELTGVGTGNYVGRLIELAPDQLVWVYKPVHNIYALVAGENGVVGLTIWLWLVGAGLWLWWQVVRRDWQRWWVGVPLMGALVIGLTDHWLISFQQGRIWFFLALALIILGARGIFEKVTKGTE